MATGDRICPNCNQWAIHCKCGWAAALLRGSWDYTAGTGTSEYIQRADIPPQPPGVLTTTAKPGDPYVWMMPQTWGVTTTTTTTTTRKPRKRRHYRQVVY